MTFSFFLSFDYYAVHSWGNPFSFKSYLKGWEPLNFSFHQHRISHFFFRQLVKSTIYGDMKFTPVHYRV